MDLEFRGLAGYVRSVLPSSFGISAEVLEDMSGPPFGDACGTTVDVDPQLADSILAWGRDMSAGASRLRFARLHDRYELTDLDGLDFVEIYPNYDVETQRIRNFKTAFRLVWACSTCPWVDGEQVEDLDLIFNESLDLLSTYNSEWIAHKRIHPILSDAGISLRPLKSGPYAQILVSDVVAVRTNVLPLVTSYLCPECGRPHFGRKDVVEGDGYALESPEMAVFKASPITTGPIPASLSIVRSDVSVYTQMSTPHKAGQRFNYTYIDSYYYNQTPFYVAAGSLVRRLLEFGATGLSFRPLASRMT
jgi:hypothetical protein